MSKKPGVSRAASPSRAAGPARGPAAPLRSMTGYGRGAAGGAVVEIRSVNGRFLKWTIKLPPGWGVLEERVKDLLTKAGVRRGTIEAGVYVGETAEEPLEVNARAVAFYAAQLKRINKDLRAAGLPPGAVAPETVLTLPGVLRRGERRFDAAAAWARLEPALRRAAERFVKMRAKEGAALAADVRAHLRALEDKRREAARLAPEAVHAQSAKLRERLRRLLDEADAGRPAPGADSAAAGVQLRDAWEREAALAADRCDVSEELARLAAHFGQMNGLLARGGDEAGKTLDFLTQELLREVNTVGSKVQDVRVTRCVVAMKGLIEKIREQAQNVE